MSDGRRERSLERLSGKVVLEWDAERRREEAGNLPKVRRRKQRGNLWRRKWEKMCCGQVEAKWRGETKLNQETTLFVLSVR